MWHGQSSHKEYTPSTALLLTQAVEAGGSLVGFWPAPLRMRAVCMVMPLCCGDHKPLWLPGSLRLNPMHWRSGCREQQGDPKPSASLQGQVWPDFLVTLGGGHVQETTAHAQWTAALAQTQERRSSMCPFQFVLMCGV